METFAPPKALVENANFANQRRASLVGLDEEMIDPPIRLLIRRLNQLDYCFTLQCCCGHFVYPGQSDPHNLEPLPPEPIPGPITYRIAYLALCIAHTDDGRALLATLGRLPDLDPANIQFGSPGWFWGRQVNSYALQVEPERFMHQDQAVLGHAEAVEIEALRTELFDRLAGAL